MVAIYQLAFFSPGQKSEGIATYEIYHELRCIEKTEREYLCEWLRFNTYYARVNIVKIKVRCVASLGGEATPTFEYVTLTLFQLALLTKVRT